MTPPVARTWGRRGHTPVIRVRGRSRRRTSVTALCCYKPGEPSRLIHRPRNHLLLKGARKSFSWKDDRDLLVRAHIQPGEPIVVVWDNLNTHLAAGLKRYEAEHNWLTTFGVCRTRLRAGCPQQGRPGGAPREGRDVRRR
ncbi:hypothetical protein ACGFX2_39015 [Streptomyces goshikiensis]|uniref:hypothetical protein n=1 Tax=Streptomyces goshikiensis TaxID=1942 RepID=UPI0037136878